MTSQKQWLQWINQLQAIAQNGLTFTANHFDKLRFESLQALCAEMMVATSSMKIEEISMLLAKEVGYTTPKIDVRAAVFKEDKILMVREIQDNLWTLPGGWIDVNESASEAAEREVLEESGFIVKAVKLIGLYDKLKQDHPPQWPHAYKCFFLCDLVGGTATVSDETNGVDFFALDELPGLSLHRITQKQIQQCFKHRYNPELLTEFD